MMVGIAVVLGLVFLQADDDFVGVQDRCVICRNINSFIFTFSSFFSELVPFSLQSSMLHSSTFMLLKYFRKRSQYLCKFCTVCAMEPVRAATCEKDHLSNNSIFKFPW